MYQGFTITQKLAICWTSPEQSSLGNISQVKPALKFKYLSIILCIRMGMFCSHCLYCSDSGDDTTEGPSVIIIMMGIIEISIRFPKINEIISYHNRLHISKHCIICKYSFLFYHSLLYDSVILTSPPLTSHRVRV